MTIEETVELLFDRNNNAAYKALQELEKESGKTSRVYPFTDLFIRMLESQNSYIRTRGLTLLACNARWDQDKKIDDCLDAYLVHITDEKPVTARQCIRCLPQIAEYKPELKSRIIAALEQADLSGYEQTMEPLVRRDIQKALKRIQTLG